MGYLESAVVVYLREIYYPLGFAFPISPLSEKIALTEIFREVATLVMLVSIAFLAGRTTRQRFAWFIYAFGVWDIFYYIFLKVLVHWPESLLTWDILFLIPVMWTGPVAAPVIVSATMMLLALIILNTEGRAIRSSFFTYATLLIIAGSSVIFLSFIWDFSTFILKRFPVSAFFDAVTMNAALVGYIPVKFNWWLFTAGELFLVAGSAVLYAGYFKDRRT